MVRLPILIVALFCGFAARAEPPALKPFGAGPVPAAPWKVIGLPSQTKPYTRFQVTDLEGQRVLRVEASKSFGNLVHLLGVEVPGGTALTWRWRVDQFPAAADLRKRSGDDTALKVCVFFDEPFESVPVADRPALRLARQRNPQLPAATICYVWDNLLAVGTALPNAYTPRMRYLVLESGPAHLREWRNVRRDIAADFLQLFGAETTRVPAVVGVGVGADADNGGGQSLAHVADLRLEP